MRSQSQQDSSRNLRKQKRESFSSISSLNPIFWFDMENCTFAKKAVAKPIHNHLLSLSCSIFLNILFLKPFRARCHTFSTPTKPLARHSRPQSSLPRYPNSLALTLYHPPISASLPNRIVEFRELRAHPDSGLPFGLWSPRDWRMWFARIVVPRLIDHCGRTKSYTMWMNMNRIVKMTFWLTV